MASLTARVPAGEPEPPTTDPVAIRGCLPASLITVFDAEWDIILDRAKAKKDLADVHRLLHKWRHIAYTELLDPGSYARLKAKAQQILRTGENPTAGSFEDMQALLQDRLAGP